MIYSCIFFTIPNYASCASELSSFSRQGINFSIQEDNNNIVLKVNNPNIVSANKFTLPNPARIIIDISGLKIRQSENITVNECAQRCGYTSLSSFANAFKRKFNMSPNVYKKEMHRHLEKEKHIKL